MYSREEVSYIRQQFWTRFGKYMAPILSAEGQKINWINYKTGIRHLNFRMDATNEFAYIGVEISHKNPLRSAALYEQFKLLQPALEDVLGEKWRWDASCENDQQQVLSSVSIDHRPCNIFKETDWPEIISFLKPRILKLDEFWCAHKMIFEMMG